MKFASRSLSLHTPRVMGVLNVTPDSFSDGGHLYLDGKIALDLCLQKAEAMVLAGAEFIDVGGESTRPGAASVSSQEEIDRVAPVVEALVERFDVIVSVDTSNPQLMQISAAAGAGLINDVRALERDGAVAAVAASGLPVCLMHMQGAPPSMQDQPSYFDVLTEVNAYLSQRVRVCLDAGIGADALILDPGIGFGKSDEHNLALIKGLSSLSSNEWPILVGVSRKSMLGRLLGRETDQRLAGSLALAYALAQQGVSILRVHDVAETVDVLKIFRLLKQE